MRIAHATDVAKIITSVPPSDAQQARGTQHGYLIHKGVIIAAADRADHVDVGVLGVHVNLGHHEVEGRAHSQHIIQVSKVALQVGVARQGHLLLQPPAPPINTLELGDDVLCLKC